MKKEKHVDEFLHGVGTPNPNAFEDWAPSTDRSLQDVIRYRKEILAWADGSTYVEERGALHQYSDVSILLYLAWHEQMFFTHEQWELLKPTLEFRNCPFMHESNSLVEDGGDKLTAEIRMTIANRDFYI